MTHLDHGITDCKGFKITESLPWNLAVSQHSETPNHWGFLLCGPPEDKENVYGAIGETETEVIGETGLGIPMANISTLQSPLVPLALACGLSVIDKAQLELGDTAIVAGMNPLAYSILTAAKSQGARTACLTSGFKTTERDRSKMQTMADALFEFESVSSFEEGLDAFLASSIGKVVYIDAAGRPDLVYAMAARLRTFSTLVLCRQESTTFLQLDIRRHLHITSARVYYWTRPECLEEALALLQYYRQAANLFQWNRLPQLQNRVFGISTLTRDSEVKDS